MLNAASSKGIHKDIVRAVIFDLGDTLIHGSYTAREEYEMWEEVYKRSVLSEDIQQLCSRLPSSNDFSASIKKNVYGTIAMNRTKRGEKEFEYLSLFEKALEAVGLSCLTNTHLIYRIMKLEVNLRYNHFYKLGTHTTMTLKRLRECGYQLGMVSNFCCIPDIAYSGLERFDLIKLFDETLLSCEIGWSKPSPHIYMAICQKLGVLPEECLFVGDRLFEDVVGPQRLGMQTILTHEFRQEIPTHIAEPDAIISQLNQMLDIMTSQNNAGSAGIPHIEQR